MSNAIKRQQVDLAGKNLAVAAQRLVRDKAQCPGAYLRVDASIIGSIEFYVRELEQLGVLPK